MPQFRAADGVVTIETSGKPRDDEDELSGGRVAALDHTPSVVGATLPGDITATSSLQLPLHSLAKPNKRPRGILERGQYLFSVGPGENHERVVVCDCCAKAFAKRSAN